MTASYYASGVGVFPDTTYTPSGAEFLPPHVVIKNIGDSTFAVRRYVSSSTEGDPYELTPGEAVNIPIPDGETFRPILYGPGYVVAQGFVAGWVEE